MLSHKSITLVSFRRFLLPNPTPIQIKNADRISINCAFTGTFEEQCVKARAHIARRDKMFAERGELVEWYLQGVTADPES